MPLATTRNLPFNPVGFHHSLPLFYTGISPVSCFRYSTRGQGSIELTSNTLTLNSDTIAVGLHHSVWANMFVLHKNIKNADSEIRTYQLNGDGSIGAPVSSAPFGCNALVSVLAPGGRFLAAPNLSNPYLNLGYFIQDGTCGIMNFYFPSAELPGTSYVAFTPSGRGLIMLCRSGPYLLRFYEVDPARGLILRGTVPFAGLPVQSYNTPSALAMTPDGRYIIFSAMPFTGYNMLFVMRVHEESWSLEYLWGRERLVDHIVIAAGFAPVPESGTDPSWSCYE